MNQVLTTATEVVADTAEQTLTLAERLNNNLGVTLFAILCLGVGAGIYALVKAKNKKR